MAASASYSEAFVNVPKTWLAAYYRVQPTKTGRYFIAGPCPVCHHLLCLPLGEQTKKKWYRRKKPATDESKSTTLRCGCGEAHVLSEQDTRLGCGRRWNLELKILFSENAT